MFAFDRCRIAGGDGIRLGLVALAFILGFNLSNTSYAQSVHHDSYALAKAFAVDPIASKYSSEDEDKAYDRMSATWMQFFGESAFVAAREPILVAMNAMQQIGWLAPNTSVVITMLDARGDFAQFAGESCTVHINIDDRGSSPIIGALGNLRSSVAFVAAHELAHCRFDTLSILERFPDRQQLRSLGFSNKLAIAILNALSDPIDTDGSAAFLTAYDESLADAAASIALARAETAKQHFGTALENAQSLRFGELFMANRDAIPRVDHQGGFVFEAFARQARPNMSWRLAKQVAMQSVLLSSAYSANEPQWFKTLVQIDPHKVQQMRRKWQDEAHRQLDTRRSTDDENHFYAATSDALLSIDSAQYPAANLDVSAEVALMRWKEIAWLSSETKPTVPRTTSAQSYRKSPVQAIVTKRDQVP
jgi:hypothetical protein